jgi:hypothetical protein
MQLTASGPARPSGSTESVPGATLDTGALIGIERGAPKMQALLDEASAAGLPFSVPAGALGQVWRGTPRQPRLARFLRLANVTVVPLDEPAARAVGALCGRTGVDDIVDASVVICARLREDVVVTSDPADLRRLDPHLRISTI